MRQSNPSRKAGQGCGFLVFVYVIAMIVGGMASNTNVFAESNVTNPVQGVVVYATEIINSGPGIIVTAPMVLWNFFQSLFSIMLLDFPVFQTGWWVYLRWIILAPIMGIVVYGIVTAFFSLFRSTV